MSEKTLKKLIYGTGRIRNQSGVTADGDRCLCLTEMDKAYPVGSAPKDWQKERAPESSFDVLLVFKTLESARVLQDELNELVSLWAKEEALRVDMPKPPQPEDGE